MGALSNSVDYITNPNKTNGCELVRTYECDPLTAAREFQFSKQEYAAITGRDQGVNDIIAYHMRISFKPGETDPETAGRIAYELALKLTKGRHAFLSSVHIDKAHCHAHVIINSTSLECDRKFRNFYNSSFALRKMSDMLCLENGLSVIKNPQPRRGKDYDDWLGDRKPVTNRERLEQMIDSVIPACKSFDNFLDAMKAAGCEIKRGKNVSIKISGAERFARCKSLGSDYTETAILERIDGKRTVVPKHIPDERDKQEEPRAAGPAPVKPNLLIDIQAKLQQGYGEGYRNWAVRFNLKEASKTLIYLQEKGIVR